MKHTKFYKEVGVNIARLRRMKKLSQLDVCALLNLDQSNLSAIEKGRVNPSLKTLMRIAFVLEVEPKQLLDIDLSIKGMNFGKDTLKNFDIGKISENEEKE